MIRTKRPFRARLLLSRMMWAEFKRRHGKAMELLLRLDEEFDAWVKANPPGEDDLRKRRPPAS